MFFTPAFIAFTLFLLANTQTTTTSTSTTTTSTTTMYGTTTHMTAMYETPPFTTTRSKTFPILPTSSSDEQTPKAVQEYLSSITVQPEFRSASKAVQSAIPLEEYAAYVRDGTDPFSSWPGNYYPPAWMSAVPQSDRLFIASYKVWVDRIKTSLMMRPEVTEAIKGSAPTNRPRVEVVGAALAAGAAGLAML